MRNEIANAYRRMIKEATGQQDVEDIFTLINSSIGQLNIVSEKISKVIVMKPNQEKELEAIKGKVTEIVEELNNTLPSLGSIFK